MGGLGEGLSQAQWLRPNWLGIETAGNVQKGSHNEDVFTNTSQTLQTVFEIFLITLKAKGLCSVC